MFKILQDRCYGLDSKQKLYNAAKGNIDFVQRLKLHKKIEVHSGCVNTICWNETGQYLLSGSDDQHLVISEPWTGKFTSVRSGHRANIFSAKFLPYSNEKIISCSGDGKIYYTDVDTSSRNNLFDCHFGTTYEVIVIPSESSTFLSCGEDGTVRWFDLRAKTSCIKEDCKEDILINCRRAVTSIAVNPLIPYELSIACADSSVRIYDRRMLGTKASGSHSSKGILGMTCKFTAPTLSSRPHRITSLAYSPNGEDILVSYSSEYIYLFGSKDFKTKRLQTPAEFIQKSKHKAERLAKKVKSSDLFAEKPTKPPPKHKTPEPQHSSRGSRDPPADLPLSSTPPRTSSSPRLSTSEGVTSMLLPQSPSGSSLRQPPIKRLRLRGDWSDTGPHARPESERHTNEQPDRQTTIMQRMSDMLTRWLDGNLRRQEEEEREDEAAGRGSEAQASGGQDVSGERSGDVVNEAAPAAEDMDTENTVNTTDRRTQNSTGINQDSSVENQASDTENQDINDRNQDNIHSSDITPQPECDNQDPSSTSSAIQNPRSLSDPQVTLAESEASVQTRSVGPASRGTANTEENQGISGVRSSVERRGQHVGLLVQEEPVISLQYSSEGTTSSTVRLGFARFENLEAGILERSAENASLQPLVREATPTSSRDFESHETAGGSDEAKREDSVGFADSTDSSDIFDSDSFSGESGKEESGEKSESTVIETETNSTAESQRAEKSSEVLVESEGENQPCSSSQADGQTQRAGRRKASAAVKEKIRQIGRMRILERLCRERGSGLQPDRFTGDSGTSEEEEEEIPVVRGTSHSSDHATGEHEEDVEIENRTRTSDHQRNEAASSDEEGEGQSRETLERHITAIRLQELYKKRQEERENEEIETRSIHQPLHKIKFKGHRNARTMIKEANFWGDQFVMSGSDCGHIFIWDRYTAKLAMLLEADRHVVNCLQPHPIDPILASSGIDYDIKLWMPLEENPHFEEEIAAEIMRRNEVMLEETRDTITVPAAFMLRVLASLNQIRAGRASSSNEPVVENDSSSSDSE